MRTATEVQASYEAVVVRIEADLARLFGELSRLMAVYWLEEETVLHRMADDGCPLFKEG